MASRGNTGSLCALLLLVLAVSPASGSVATALAAQERGDFDVARCEFQRLALRNDPVAEYYVGRMYLEGKTVTPDMGEALEWLSRAARNGHILAQRDLGDLHMSDALGEPDYVEAYRWYKMAKQQFAIAGVATDAVQENTQLDATKKLWRLRKKLSPDAQERAQTLAQVEKQPVRLRVEVSARYALPDGTPFPDGRISNYVEPAYPETVTRAVMQRHLFQAGRVKLDATIGVDGSAERVDVVESRFLTETEYQDPRAAPIALPLSLGISPEETLGQYASEAREAVRRWRFETRHHDGEATKIHAEILIDFVPRLNAAYSQTLYTAVSLNESKRESWIWSRAERNLEREPIKSRSRMHVSYASGDQPAALQTSLTERLSKALSRQKYRVVAQDEASYRVTFGFGTKAWSEHYTHYFAVSVLASDGGLVWKGEARLDTVTRDPCDPLDLLDRLMRAAVDDIGRVDEGHLVERE